MTVHAFEIVTSDSQESSPSTEPAPGPPDWVGSLLEDRMTQNVLGTHTETLPDQASPMSNVTPQDGGTAHIRGHRRFEAAEDKATVLDAIEQNVVIDAEWHEIRYHDCTHDGTGGACPDWTAERSNGTVPGDV